MFWLTQGVLLVMKVSGLFPGMTWWMAFISVLGIGTLWCFCVMLALIFKLLEKKGII